MYDLHHYKEDVEMSDLIISESAHTT